MYQNLIVGVDGRQGGADAAALAAVLAGSDASLTLVYVSTIPLASRASTRELDLADDASLPALFAAELDGCGDDARVRRVAAATVGAGLEQAAERQGADMIVVGACRRRGLARLLSGDDAKSVLRQTPCAVAVAPPLYARHPAPLERVGVAYDQSPQSEAAVAHAGLIATDRRSQLRVLHVVAPHYYAPGCGMPPVPLDQPSAEVAAAEGTLAQVAGFDIEHVYGSPADKLVEFSEDVDLLVCGSRHHRPLRRLAEGSISDHLARHAASPLLVTPVIDPPSVERRRAALHAARA